MDNPDVKQIVESMLGETNWISPVEGYCRCPGGHLHSSPDRERDCKFYCEPVPTLTCFHASCSDVIAETNHRLRSAIAKNVLLNQPKRKLTAEEKFRQAKAREAASLKTLAASLKSKVLRDFCWNYASIQSDSPVKIDSDPLGHWVPVLSLFEANDLIWIAPDVKCSGGAEHGGWFKLREEWMSDSSLPPGAFICPTVFKPGSTSRGNANILERRFLVVESDVLDRNTVGAVFWWMSKECGLDLRCIVDTGGKSLHAWFKFPKPDEVEELKIILPEFGCDPKMFTASQPCRLPGWPRNGGHQKLVYLNGGAL